MTIELKVTKRAGERPVIVSAKLDGKNIVSDFDFRSAIIKKFPQVERIALTLEDLSYYGHFNQKVLLKDGTEIRFPEFEGDIAFRNARDSEQFSKRAKNFANFMEFFLQKISKVLSEGETILSFKVEV
jgi:hypothetical protein